MTTASPLFDAPGPRTRRIFAFANVAAVLVLAAGLGWVVWMLARNGQLAAAKWTPFLAGSTWVDYLLPGLLGTLGAARDAGAAAENMRHALHTGIDGGINRLVVPFVMPAGDHNAARNAPVDEFGHTGKFRRNGDQAHKRTVMLDQLAPRIIW